MIIVNSQEGEGELVGMSPHIHIERHLDLQIKTLENATRDADKLERPFRIKKKTEGGQLLVPFVRPQLFFCKRVDWSKSKVEPAANTVAIVAFEIYLASAAVS